MKRKTFVFILAFLIMFAPLAFSQSKETGAIIGTVTDEENTPLPGVSMTLTGTTLMGSRSTVTDIKGQYRFPALPPGTYSVRAELQGFASTVQEDIRLHTTVRLTVDFSIKLSAVEEEITVIAESPTVDVKTSETASVTLSAELLRNMPTGQFVTDIVNLAPGVDQDTAYGAASGTGISYQVDGVDVSDPDGGTAWVFLDYNILEEAKIMGIGLPAEYGAFTGVIFNTITKSGGNELSGHAEFIFQDTKKGFWTAENNKSYIEDFPNLVSPVSGLMDTSIHIGGPIQKDKIWFFIGAQYMREKNRPAGFQAPNFVDYKEPRIFMKITAQPSSIFNLTTFFEYDVYNGINRRASATHPTPETCVKQTSPDQVGNFDLTTILNPTTFVDIKAAFFIGYYYLDPNGGMDTTATYSAEQKKWLGNSNWFYKGDRKRYQANASISHYAENFIQGSHDFKFGTEFEYGWTRDRYGYTGQNNWYIYDWFGYLYAYQYEGYDIETSYTRTELFVQDSWSISDNVTLNIGARYSMYKGGVKDVSGSVYSANRIAPRVGFAWDILGDHTTVLKAHYGRFTETILSALHSRLNLASNFSDFVGYSQVGGEWVEDWRTPHESLYTMGDDVTHPYMDQFTLGIERELFKDASFGVSYIHRQWKSLIGLYDTLAEYETVTLNDPETSATYTVYNQTNPGAHAYIMDNTQKGDPWILDDSYRKYQGVEFLFTKRFSNRWQLTASYIYSKCKGTIDNSQSADYGRAGSVANPNFWINTDGRMTRDPTHMLKFQGTYVLPFDIWFNAYFSYISGNTYTRAIRPSLDQGRNTIFTEERGSQRYSDLMSLDLRLEKTFTFDEKYRIGFMIDIFNVFNYDTIDDWGTWAGVDWNPGDPGPDGHYVYGLTDPRAVRLGIRVFF